LQIAVFPSDFVAATKCMENSHRDVFSINNYVHM